jgi:hypothetical protein
MAVPHNYKDGYVILYPLVGVLNHKTGSIVRYTSLRYSPTRQSKLLVDSPIHLSQSYPLKNFALLWLFVVNVQCYSSK